MEVSLYTVDDIYVEEVGHNAEIHEGIDNAQVKQGDLTKKASEYSIMEIVAPGVDKGDALRELAGILSVDDDGVAHVIDNFVLQGRTEESSEDRKILKKG